VFLANARANAPTLSNPTLVATASSWLGLASFGRRNPTASASHVAERELAMTRLIVTSSSGSNGDGYGTVLAFTPEGELLGRFSNDDRISDPRGLVLHPVSDLVYLNSGPDRILALNQAGAVTHDSGILDGLDPGGAIFGPDGRLYVTLRRRGTVLALSATLDDQGMALLPDRVVPFPTGSI
jgi:hypothetical protein